MQQIQSTDHGFCCDSGRQIRRYLGRSQASGGDSSAVRDQLKGVQHIQATHMAFAAILEGRSLITWGHADYGGDSSAVRDQLKGVQQIQAAVGAFAAILEDGVVTWGDANYGGSSGSAQGCAAD